MDGAATGTAASGVVGASATPAPELELAVTRECALPSCLAAPSRLRCTACWRAHYCVPEHQRLDWERHRVPCRAAVLVRNGSALARREEDVASERAERRAQAAAEHAALLPGHEARMVELRVKRAAHVEAEASRVQHELDDAEERREASIKALSVRELRAELGVRGLPPPHGVPAVELLALRLAAPAPTPETLAAWRECERCALTMIACRYCGALFEDDEAGGCCGGCGRVRYCGAQCQRADWSSHEPDCGEVRRANTEAQALFGARVSPGEGSGAAEIASGGDATYSFAGDSDADAAASTGVAAGAALATVALCDIAAMSAARAAHLRAERKAFAAAANRERKLRRMQPAEREVLLAEEEQPAAAVLEAAPGAATPAPLWQCRQWPFSMLVASILAVLVMLCAGSIGEVPGDGAAEVQALRKLRGNPAAALDTAALAVALLRTFAGNAAMINEAALSLFTIANRSDGGIAACLAVSAPAALVATAGRWAVKSNSEAAMTVAAALAIIGTTAPGHAACLAASAPSALVALASQSAVRVSADTTMAVAAALSRMAGNVTDGPAGQAACVAASVPAALVSLAHLPTTMGSAGAAQNIAIALFRIASNNDAGAAACVAAVAPRALVALLGQRAVLSSPSAAFHVGRAFFFVALSGTSFPASILASAPAAFVALAGQQVIMEDADTALMVVATLSIFTFSARGRAACLTASVPAAFVLLAGRPTVHGNADAVYVVAVALANMAAGGSDGLAACTAASAPAALVHLASQPVIAGNVKTSRRLAQAIGNFAWSAGPSRAACVAAGAIPALESLAAQPAVVESAEAAAEFADALARLRDQNDEAGVVVDMTLQVGDVVDMPHKWLESAE